MMKMNRNNQLFRYEVVFEYDDPITGDGKTRVFGHYRVYERATGDYVGYIARDDNRDNVWRALVPNPRYDPTEGPGCMGGHYVGRDVNPVVIAKRGSSRKELADVLAAHRTEFPKHVPVEVRPACERRQPAEAKS